jgi:hypothetical protein
VDLSKIARALNKIEVREAGDTGLDCESGIGKIGASDDAGVPRFWVLACLRVARH